jgi:hypothetical protein
MASAKQGETPAADEIAALAERFDAGTMHIPAAALACAWR